MRLLCFTILVSLVLMGCSIWNHPMNFAVVGQGADLVSTGIVICGSDNFVELNPLYTFAGEDCLQVLGSSLLFKSGLLFGLNAICKPKECPSAWRIMGGLGFGAAVWNTTVR